MFKIKMEIHPHRKFEVQKETHLHGDTLTEIDTSWDTAKDTKLRDRKREREGGTESDIYIYIERERELNEWSVWINNWTNAALSFWNMNTDKVFSQ